MELWLGSIIMTTACWQSISLWIGFKVPKGWKLGIKDKKSYKKELRTGGKDKRTEG